MALRYTYHHQGRRCWAQLCTIPELCERIAKAFVCNLCQILFKRLVHLGQLLQRFGGKDMNRGSGWIVQHCILEHSLHCSSEVTQRSVPRTFNCMQADRIRDQSIVVWEADDVTNASERVSTSGTSAVCGLKGQRRTVLGVRPLSTLSPFNTTDYSTFLRARTAGRCVPVARVPVRTCS